MNSSVSDSPYDWAQLVSCLEVLVGFISLLTIVPLICHVITLCQARRNIFRGVLPFHRRQIERSSVAAAARPGLDQAALEAFPKLTYSKANGISNTNIGRGINDIYSTSLSCSVCLADYDESDTIRVLPVCGHVFHLLCIDSWLRLNPTCPLCRKLPRMNSV